MPGATINWVKKWEQWKSSNDYIDFTDMITITSTMKEPFPGRPLVGIYDEVQDFNRLELNLIRHWSQFQDHIILAGMMISAFMISVEQVPMHLLM